METTKKSLPPSTEEQNNKFMRIAIKLATENVEKGIGQPFGAVIVKDGKIIAQAANTGEVEMDPTAHAEIEAIRIACKKLNTRDLSGAVVYASAEPCPMCVGAMVWTNIAGVYFGNTKDDTAEAGFSDSKLYEEINKPIMSREMPAQPLLRNEALVSFDLWKKKRS